MYRIYISLANYNPIIFDETSQKNNYDDWKRRFDGFTCLV